MYKRKERGDVKTAAKLIGGFTFRLHPLVYKKKRKKDTTGVEHITLHKGGDALNNQL